MTYMHIQCGQYKSEIQIQVSLSQKIPKIHLTFHYFTYFLVCIVSACEFNLNLKLFIDYIWLKHGMP